MTAVPVHRVEAPVIDHALVARFGNQSIVRFNDLSSVIPFASLVFIFATFFHST